MNKAMQRPQKPKYIPTEVEKPDSIQIGDCTRPEIHSNEEAIAKPNSRPEPRSAPEPEADVTHLRARPCEEKAIAESDSKSTTIAVRLKSASGETEETVHQGDHSGNEQKAIASTQDNSRFFQAIGHIRGIITEAEEKLQIQLKDKTYSLLPASGYGKCFLALKQHLKAHPEEPISLAVYPKVIHFPDREKPHIVLFQVKGFQGTAKKPIGGITSELPPGEFKLSGFWQFIPVYRFPVISVFRNFNKDLIARCKEIKAENPLIAKKLSQAQHVPLMWRDAPVPPFRFNPKVDKDKQGERYFVQVKARFISAKDSWGFDSLTGVPIVEAPRFVKTFKPEQQPGKVKSKKKSEKSEVKQEKQKNGQSSQAEAAQAQQSHPNPGSSDSRR